ncbi:MAG: helix-turn-helix domain-containing protein [Chitinophagales bacterium]
MFRVEQERQLRGWSQAEVARRTGIHPVTICQLEAGKIHPYPGWKERLSKVLGIPEDELFQLVGNAQPPMTATGA